jgi:hypothetical protein
MANEDRAATDDGTPRAEAPPGPLKRWRLLVAGKGAARFVMRPPTDPYAPRAPEHGSGRERRQAPSGT